MIDLIPGLIDRILQPNSRPGSPLTVTGVFRTAEVYLVFDGNDDHPKYVVKVGPRARFESLARALQALSCRLGGRMPAVLGGAEIPGERYAILQSGLSGSPWFRLASAGNVNELYWEKIRREAIEALQAFQDAVRTSQDWNEGVSLRAELAALHCELARFDDGEFRELALQLFDRYESEIVLLSDQISAAWRHGDYSLNNLIFRDEGAAIIDFDEFGLTCVPLFDEVGLVLSMLHFQALDDSLDNFHMEFNRCFSKTIAVVPLALNACLAMYLLIFKAYFLRDGSREGLRLRYEKLLSRLRDA